MMGIARIWTRSCKKWCVCFLYFSFPAGAFLSCFLDASPQGVILLFLSCNGFARSSFQGNSLWINQICTRHLLWVQFQAEECEGIWGVRPKVYLSSTIPSLDRFLVLLDWVKIKKIHTHTHTHKWHTQTKKPRNHWEEMKE